MSETYPDCLDEHGKEITLLEAAARGGLMPPLRTLLEEEMPVDWVYSDALLQAALGGRDASALITPFIQYMFNDLLNEWVIT